MLNVTWFFCLILFLFVCTLGIFSFSIDSPEGTVKFNGWMGRFSEVIGE